MSWVITGSEKNPVDLFRSNVSLLLHCDGTNGSTTITDSSLLENTGTVVSNAVISTTESQFGGSSLYLPGDGSYVSFNASVLQPASSDWTVEWWQKLATTDTTYPTIATAINGGFRASNGALQVFGGPVANVAAFSSLTTNWQHIAFSRQSGTVRLFRDGTLLSNDAANLTATVSTTRFDIGRPTTSYPNSFNGYIDELRVTVGVARYTANFTSPTAAFPDI